MPRSLPQNLFFKKANAVVDATEAAENRRDVARLCGWAAIALLLISFVFDVILVMDFSRPYQVAQYSQDEYWFMETIIRLQNYILAFDIEGIRSFGSPFAYGFPFWLFAAIIALPLHSHAMLMTLFLRLVCMAMKYGAFLILYRRILALTQKPLLSLMSLALMLAIPAFVFDGKIIGPEYFIMLLIAAGWSALFVPARRAQMGAAFSFALAATIKINAAPLALIFPGVLLANPVKKRRELITSWLVGGLIAIVLFFIPAHPFQEITAVGATHHISYGFEYLSHWYGYNALEFDDMLVGGWSVDFISWFLFLVLAGYAVYRVYKPVDGPKSQASVITISLWTFAVSTFICIAISFTSLLHTWFVFAPFLLLLVSGSLLIGMGREGTAVMALFLLIYASCFGERYFLRWQHRIAKFEYVAATEPANAEVASWIAAHCPKAREAVIDYNLIWPSIYDGNLQKMWTLIEVEDYRHLKGSATELVDKIDLLLLKGDRVTRLLPPNSAPDIKIPAAILGNFFPATEPYFVRQKDFQQLSIFARDGTCKK